MINLHSAHPITFAVMVFGGLLAFVTSHAISSMAFKWTFFPDNPDGLRKMQTAPVSRFGGIAILLGFVLSSTSIIVLAKTFPFLSLTGAALPPLSDFAAAAFVASMIITGIVDDSVSLPATVKLVLFTLSAVAAAAFGIHATMLTSPLGDISTPVILVIGSALWLFAFTNATNFMDGANGLSTGCLLIMFVGTIIAHAGPGDLTINLWWLVLFGAIAGFLIHNLRGRIYLGDAGALGLGALYACIAIILDLEPWTVATLAWPFLIEIFMTLGWRAFKGHSWLKPHYDHAYQCLRSQGWSHLETSFLYWGLSVACAACAIIAARAGGHAPFITFWILCPVGMVGWIAHRKTLDHNR